METNNVGMLHEVNCAEATAIRALPLIKKECLIMKSTMKKFYVSLGLLASAICLASCTDADVASQNLSKAADQFEINRRIVFYNGVTNQYMLTIEGLCSLGNFDAQRELTVTCKTGPNAFKKHFLGLSDNVTYIVEQIDAADVNVYHYKVIFKPETIIPDIDLK